MVDYARAWGRSRKGHRRYRVSFSIIAADASGAASQTAPATFNATALGDGCSMPATSAPDDRWSQSDGVPGVLLQCNIFHLCADSYRLLWRRGGPGRLGHSGLWAWPFSWPPAEPHFLYTYLAL